MKKEYFIPDKFIKDIASGFGGAIASDMIMVDGRSVGYMYREEPINNQDAGWRFMSGFETQEYVDDPNHLAFYDINTIANYDRDIIKYLDLPIGSVLGRENGIGELLPD